MERTPSPPPSRPETPPGPKHRGDYVPYAPRRSSRVAAQKESQKENQSTTSTSRPESSRIKREVTPNPLRKKTAASRLSVQGDSPPPTPISHAKHRTPRSMRRANISHRAASSESDYPAPTPSKRSLTAMGPSGALPTPAKTPRKLPLQSEETLQSTSRLLFKNNRPATVEDAMPTPQKMNRMNAITFESFAEQMEESSQKIEIFTDSHDRIPTADESEDNPFRSKKGKGKAKAKSNGSLKSRKSDPQATEMEDAVHRDEGIIYMFRGKKVFRKFEDGPSPGVDDGLEYRQPGAAEILHTAGPEAMRPLTRAGIKPKTLFKDAIKKRNRSLGLTDNEEADTDIEASTPSRKKAPAMELGTPVKPLELTPPPTVKPIRRQMSFEAWTRVKSSTNESSSSSKKRAGDTLESADDKRTKSENSSPMSLGS